MARKNPVEHLYRHQTPTPALVGEVRALGAAVLPTLQAMACTTDAENSRAWTGADAAPCADGARGALAEEAGGAARVAAEPGEREAAGAEAGTTLAGS